MSINDACHLLSSNLPKKNTYTHRRKKMQIWDRLKINLSEKQILIDSSFSVFLGFNLKKVGNKHLLSN